MMENQKVYEKAIEILEKYFILEEQQDIMEMLTQPSPSGPSNESSSLYANASTAGQNQFMF